MINLQDLLDEKRSERFNNLLSVIKDETRKTQFNNFLAYLVDNTDYFNAPASPAYHCSWPHGLVDHSMNVAENALKLNKCLNAGCNEEELVIGGLCHDCLPSDVKISTSRGDISMKDIRIGDNVVVNGIEYPVIKKWDTGYKESIKVTTKFGYEINTSKTHKFRVFNGNTYEFRKAGDLRKGDLLVLDKPAFGNKNIPEAYLMGFITGDGWLSLHDNSINVKIPEFDMGSRICEEFNKLGGTVYKNVNDSVERDVILNKLYYNDKAFRNKLESYGMSSGGAKLKVVPKAIFESDEKSTKEYLMGLYDSDGSVSLKKDGTYININIGSVSRDLLVGVQYLLLKFGIQSKLHVLRYAQTARGPQGEINCGDIYNLVIEGSEHIKRFRDRVSFTLRRKQERLIGFEYGYDGRKVYGVNNLVRDYELPRSMRRRICENKALTYKSLCLIKDKIEDEWEEIQVRLDTLLPIESIEDIEDQYCYDIEVEGKHWFVANGFIVHNCGKAIIDEHEPYYLVKEATPNQKKYGYVAFPMFEYNKADQNFMTVPLRAVRLLTQFVDISDDLFMAILTHDGQYVPENSPFACKECKMQLILHYADSWAGFQMEDRTVQTPSGKGYDIKHDTKEGKNGSKVRQSQTQGLRDLFK